MLLALLDRNSATLKSFFQTLSSMQGVYLLAVRERISVRPLHIYVSWPQQEYAAAGNKRALHMLPLDGDYMDLLVFRPSLCSGSLLVARHWE